MTASVCGLPISIPSGKGIFEPVVNGAAHILQASRIVEFAENLSSKLRVLAEKISTFVNEWRGTLLFAGISVAVAVMDPVRFLGACGVGMAASLVLGGITKGHRVLLVSGSMNEATAAQSALAAVYLSCRAIHSANASYILPSNFREGAVSAMLSGFWTGFVLTDVVRKILLGPAR